MFFCYVLEAAVTLKV